MPGVKIGILFPVRNCLDYTIGTVDSVRTRHAYQVYVIDDHSDAPMKEWLHGRTDIVTFTDPSLSTGLAWNWNLGISAALNDGCTHILVLNNDIVLHPQAIDRLVGRIDRGDALMCTGDDIGPPPASEKEGDLTPTLSLERRGNQAEQTRGYFPTDPNTTEESEHPNFSCFMIVPETLRRVGWFDENFIGAYYEDNDYHALMAIRGERAVRIASAPYYHYGMRTVNQSPVLGERIQRCAAHNGEFFRRKWGRMPAGSAEEMRATYDISSWWAQACAAPDRSPSQCRLETLFRQARETPSDMNEHVNTLFRLASGVEHVTEFACGEGLSACAFALARPKRLRRYQPSRTTVNTRLEAVARLAGVDYARLPVEGVDADIEPTDLLFIDTHHTEDRMQAELERHASRVRRFLVMHDTDTYGEHGEVPGQAGVWPAISAYMRRHPEWRMLHHYRNNHGLTVFVRM